MKGVLIYSLPDSTEVIRKYGTWKKRSQEEIGNTSVDSQFVISDFEKSNWFVFEENMGETKTSIELSERSNSSQISKDIYLEKVNHFKTFCEQQATRKIVLSRTKWTEKEIKNPNQIFDKLTKKYPSAFTYLISDPLFGCWIGATPETLLRGTNTHCKTMALAGSRNINNSFEWTKKEITEQKIVARYIEDILTEKKITHTQSEVENALAGNIEHLKTTFNIENVTDLFSLATALHPTPAVSGLPKEEAINFIEENEDYNRNLYTGIIGLIDQKNTHLFVNLRCAQLFSNGILNYVGGGLTKDSVPEKEWDETEFKSLTLLNVVMEGLD